MPTPLKEATVVALSEHVAGSAAVFIVEFRGLTVPAATQLRRRMREAGLELRVVKNTLFRRAIKGTPVEPLGQILQGPNAAAFCPHDPIAGAKIIKEFAAQNPAIQVKGGCMDGRFLSPADVETLSSVPPREQLLAVLVGGLQSPMSGLMFVLNGLLTEFVNTLNAICEKKAA